MRILFLSDTHLGFDQPVRPRSKRRRRGPDFFANYHRALVPALRGEVDLLIHGGDVLYRSKVPPGLVAQVFEPLKRIADQGTPVLVVPGNHERSKIPYPLLSAHPNIHIFDQPRTFSFTLNGKTLAVSGFPYAYRVRYAFSSLLEQTGWRQTDADIRLLCVHHCIEGATVGPNNYRFSDHADVIRCADLPTGFAAYLSGHIHRFQVLETDLAGRPLPAPVLYPGSTERTSFAEKDEPKGHLLLNVDRAAQPGGRLVDWTFQQLPARPMFQFQVPVHANLRKTIADILFGLPADAVVCIRITGRPDPKTLTELQLARQSVADTMNVEFRLPQPISRPPRATKPKLEEQLLPF